LFKNLNKTQILGIGLIVLSYIFWGLIFIIPFLRLGLKTSSIAISILFIGSNIFWVGVLLAGKELLVKFKIWRKCKSWFIK
jgi:VIT1/CCC1 family predicted Fe2+/Mn2+ transporter